MYRTVTAPVRKVRLKDNEIRVKREGFKRVTLDSDVAETPIAQRYKAHVELGGGVVSVNDDVRDVVHAGHTHGSGKREVHVTRFRGNVVKACTGQEVHYDCCNLHIMNQTLSCPLECSYCILQGYINNPVTTVHANVDEMIGQVREQIAAQPDRLFRIGTGDLADALALDPIGRVTEQLVPAFAKLPNAVLELKTKTGAVDQLLGLEHGGRTVVSWSLNTPYIIETEEHLCASLDERIEAAAKVVAAGYPVAFHFDPMIVYDGWRDDYPDIVRRLAARLPVARVAWISLGALRFPPTMLTTMKERFPNSRLPLGELLLASDGKMRYFKPLRMRLYRTLLAALREWTGEEVFLYFCMESRDVWRRAMGRTYDSKHDVDYDFSKNLVARYPDWMDRPLRWDAYRDAASLGASSSERDHNASLG